MKNNLIFTGLFESPHEYTEGILREFIKDELGIEEYIELGNVRSNNNLHQVRLNKNLHQERSNNNLHQVR